ncbi:hypothetical protein [Pseudothioclava arenosa]|nr:hypothetical protein [Pseudothioclava arenosa]
MHAALPLSLGTLALAACAMPGDSEASIGPRRAPEGYAVAPIGQGIAVTRLGAGFGYADGAEAKRAANAFCGAAGVASGTEDNFRAPAWVFPGGCA